MITRIPTERSIGRNRGVVLAFAAMSLLVLATIGLGIMAVAYGYRHRAISVKDETIALAAAEAGYERARVWMSQQDSIGVLARGIEQKIGPAALDSGGSYECTVSCAGERDIGSRTVYRIVSKGRYNRATKAIDVLVTQAIDGWASTHREIVSNNGTRAAPLNDANEIGMQLHINESDDGEPGMVIDGLSSFKRHVTTTESDTGQYDPYQSLFSKGISFNQPANFITDETVIQQRIVEFRTIANRIYVPLMNPRVILDNPTRQHEPAVQIEFDSSGIRVANHCTVRCWGLTPTDWRIRPGSDGAAYEQYPVYGCHFGPDYEPDPITGPGVIFVYGNVIIGPRDRLFHIPGGVQRYSVRGKFTVVAARRPDGKGGNIWIGDYIKAYSATGRLEDPPAAENPNVIALMAEGVVKVIDPRLQDDPLLLARDVLSAGDLGICRPLGIPYGFGELALPNPLVIDAAIVSAGGGWGVEGVEEVLGWGSHIYPGSGTGKIYVHGSITEPYRGLVCSRDNTRAFAHKYFFFDNRFFQGILPEQIWFSSAYVPVPGGWRDYGL